MKTLIVFLAVAAMSVGLVQNCAHAKNLNGEDGSDRFMSPWACVNEYYDKSKGEVREEYQKSRVAALESERTLLWNLVPGMMYYRMAKKTFLKKD